MKAHQSTVAQLRCGSITWYSCCLDDVSQQTTVGQVVMPGPELVRCGGVSIRGRGRRSTPPPSWFQRCPSLIDPPMASPRPPPLRAPSRRCRRTAALSAATAAPAVSDWWRGRARAVAGRRILRSGDPKFIRSRLLRGLLKPEEEYTSTALVLWPHLRKMELHPQMDLLRKLWL